MPPGSRRKGESSTLESVETLRIRISTQGRGGKTVTVVAGFTREARLMEALASDLKKALGCGGAWRTGILELQGDVRDRVRPLLVARGFTVKG
jgi:translation initiation factor 1